MVDRSFATWWKRKTADWIAGKILDLIFASAVALAGGTGVALFAWLKEASWFALSIIVPLGSGAFFLLVWWTISFLHFRRLSAIPAAPEDIYGADPPKGSLLELTTAWEDCFPKDQRSRLFERFPPWADIERLGKQLLGVQEWQNDTWGRLEGRLIAIGQAEGRLYSAESPIACRNIARIQNLPLSEAVEMLKREAARHS